MVYIKGALLWASDDGVAAVEGVDVIAAARRSIMDWTSTKASRVIEISHAPAHEMIYCWDVVVVEREDNGPLLVDDVVAQLHDYFQDPLLKKRVHESLTWMEGSLGLRFL